MTKKRFFGEDSPFTKWVREHEKLDSDDGFVVTDCDLLIHRYMTVCDKVNGRGTISTREIQALMLLEVKSRGGMPSESQIDTFSKFNLFANHKKTDSFYIRNLGVSFLSLSGTWPGDSEKMLWGRFSKTNPCEIVWKRIATEILVELLEFKIHPDSFCKNPFRRHHCKKEVYAIEQTDLGFEISRTVITRS